MRPPTLAIAALYYISVTGILGEIARPLTERIQPPFAVLRFALHSDQLRRHAESVEALFRR